MAEFRKNLLNAMAQVFPLLTKIAEKWDLGFFAILGPSFPMSGRGSFSIFGQVLVIVANSIPGSLTRKNGLEYKHIGFLEPYSETL